MAINNLTRHYKFSDPLLKQDCDALKNNVERDAVDFASRGIADTLVLEGLIQAFDAVLPDTYYRGLVSISTQERDEAKVELDTALKTIRTMAQNKWDSTDARYRIYGFERLNRSSDIEYVAMAKSIHRIATDQLADLDSEGLDQARLDALLVLRGTLDDRIDDKTKTENNRDLATQDRITKGNALYKEQLRLSNIGKDLYARTDEARYNDYIIYNTPSKEDQPAPPDPEPGNGTVQVLAQDQTTGMPLEGANIEFVGTGVMLVTDAMGQATTQLAADTYEVKVSKAGYDPRILIDFEIQPDQVNDLQVGLMPEVGPPP